MMGERWQQQMGGYDGNEGVGDESVRSWRWGRVTFCEPDDTGRTAEKQWIQTL